MKKILQRFDEMPRFFQIAFAVFLLIPIWSLFAVANPLDLVRSARLADWATLIAFWVGPLSLCVALYMRLHFVVFLFMTECAALLAHTMLGATAASGTPGMAIARAALVACVAILGFAFFSRDVAMPFFSAKRRGFRGASRLRTNSSLRLNGERVKNLQAEMEDISLVGMSFGIGVPKGSGEPPIARGDAMKVDVRLEKETYAVDGRIEWCVRDEMYYRAGFSTTDVETMSKVVKGVTLRSEPKFRQELMKLTTRTSLSRAAMVMWIGCFGGVAAIPACGEQAQFSGEAIKSTAAVKKPAAATNAAVPPKDPDIAPPPPGDPAGKPQPPVLQVPQVASLPIPPDEQVKKPAPPAREVPEIVAAEPVGCEILTSKDEVEPGETVVITMRTSGSVDTATLNGAGVAANGTTFDYVANEATLFVGSVTGASSNNSCSLSLAVKGVRLTEPPTCSLSAASSSIKKGESTQILVKRANANRMTVNGTDVEDGVEVMPVSPQASMTYSGIAFAEDGKVGACSATIVVDDVPPPPVAPDCSLLASPSTVITGSEVKLTLVPSGDVTSAKIGDQAVETSGGYAKAVVTATTTYGATVTGPGGTKTCSVKVEASALPLATCTATASPSTVNVGESVSVVVTAVGSVDTKIGALAVTPPTGATVAVPVTSSGAIVVTVKNSGGSASQCASNAVTVLPSVPAPTCTMTVAATPLVAPATTTFNWTASNSGATKIDGVATTQTSGVINVNGAAQGSYTHTVTVATSANSSPFSCSKTLTVTAPTPTRSVQSLSISPTSQSLGINAMQQFTVTANYNIAPLTETVTATATWTVPVGAGFVQAQATKGLYKGVAAGTANVTASFGGKAATATLTVTAATPAPTCTLTADATPLTAPGTTTFRWTATNSTTTKIDNVANANTSGTIALSAAAAGSYTHTITVANATGNTSCTKTVVVNAATPAPTCTMTADATPLTAPGSTTFRWTATNSTSTKVDNVANANTSGTIALSSAAAGTYTHTVTVANATGTATCSKSVVVNAPAVPAPTCSMTVDATPLTAPGTTTFRWTATNSTSTKVDNVATASTSGTIPLTAAGAGTYTHTVTVANATGTATCTKAAVVNAPAGPTCTISASKTTVYDGETMTITVAAQNSVATRLGSVTFASPAGGSQTRIPPASRSYDAWVKNAAGVETKCASVIITVNPVPGSINTTRVSIAFEDSAGGDFDFNDASVCFAGQFNIAGRVVKATAASTVTATVQHISACRNSTMRILVRRPTAADPVGVVVWDSFSVTNNVPFNTSTKPTFSIPFAAGDVLRVNFQANAPCNANGSAMFNHESPAGLQFSRVANVCPVLGG